MYIFYNYTGIYLFISSILEVNLKCGCTSAKSAPPPTILSSSPRERWPRRESRGHASPSSSVAVDARHLEEGGSGRAGARVDEGRGPLPAACPEEAKAADALGALPPVPSSLAVSLVAARR